MSEHIEDRDAPEEDFPEARSVPRRRWSLSLVWVVPLLALLLGGWAAVHALMKQGPEVTIRFKTAEGLEAGKTRLKYKDVDIGTVSNIELTDDIAGVIVTAQLSKRAKPFLAEDTRFWVVRPRIAAGAISGLGTLLSGSYIGVDIGKSQEEKRDFIGLETPPVVITGLSGKQFVLRAGEAGSIDIGSPVYFRHVKVGQVVAYDLDADGNGVTIKAFVNSPYDRYVTTRTRFWEASGLDVALDSSGVKVGIESLASLVVGGIAFQAPPDAPASTPAAADAQFLLAPNRAMAMKAPDTEVAAYVLYFEQSLRGLSKGAPVNFHGIEIGEVTSVDVEYDRTRRTLLFPVEINIYPERMRSRNRRNAVPDVEETVHHRLLDRLVSRGLRAQLKAGNLLTGQLFVSLDFVAEASPAKVDWSRTPAVIPTIKGSNLDELQATLTDVARKLGKIPFDAVAEDLRQTLGTLTTTLRSTDELVKHLDQDIAPEMRATLESAREALGSAREALAPDAPLHQDVRETLQELSRAAQALRSLADYLERHPDSLLRGRREDAPLEQQRVPQREQQREKQR